jgi:glycosyltransferase involved in cell wall biosynthesis
VNFGIISLEWLPSYGGAVIYVNRLSQRLRSLGHRVSVATASAGDAAAHVLRPPQAVDALNEVAVQAWYRGLEPWLREGDFSHILINAPLTRTSHWYARELYDLAGRWGASVGAIHYDLGRDVAAELSWAYAMTRSWEQAAAQVLDKLRAHLARQEEQQGYFEIESPLCFGPDFVLCCSEWSARFIDPLDHGARCVLHPTVSEVAADAPTYRQPSADVAFINPLAHKGAQTLVEIVERAAPEWRFRVLKGGYGQGLAGFVEAVAQTAVYRDGRLDVVDYCAEMASFYAGTRMFLFPSLYEGYGMAAVESLYGATPVVARDYPSIVEGVGEGARLVPFDATVDRWIDAINEVLACLPEWRERSRVRAAALTAREGEELSNLVDFLQAV